MRIRQQTLKRRKNSVLLLTRFPRRMRSTRVDLAQVTASSRRQVRDCRFWRRVLRTSPSWLFLEGFDAVLPRRCCHGGLRRTSLGDASRRGNRYIARFPALGGKPSPNRAGPCRARRRLAPLRRPTAGALVDPRRGRLASAQRWRPPLLDRPRIAADRGKISGHRRRFPAAGGIMFPQESRARWPNFPRTAVARVAGIGENLRGRL